MKMKTYRLYIAVLLLALLVSSCEKFLDVEPQNSILTEDAVKTPEDIQRFLVGVYDQMRNGGYLGGEMFIASDLMADNTQKDFSDFSWNQVYGRNMNLFNERGRNMWKEGFRSIYRANFIIEKMPEVSGLSGEEANRIKGEALFIRGLGHFELVRNFGLPYNDNSANEPGVPLRIKASTTIGQAVEPLQRSSVKAVYDQVLVDLKQAANLLPEANNRYATKWSAIGYLAKVYFQMNEFDSAYHYASMIVGNPAFGLADSLIYRFDPNPGNPEAIFELISTKSSDNSASALTGKYRQDKSNPGFFASNEFSAAAFLDTNDYRTRLYFNKRPINPGGTAERVYCSKYDPTTVAGTEYDYMNVPLCHYTEILLIHAESAAELNNTAQAEMDINQIRERAGLDDIAYSGQADLINKIRNERRLELAFEGNRLHDMKRFRSGDIRGIPWNSYRLVFQIPDEEQAGNPGIQLNPTGP